jgi:hypothetical protein
MNYKSTSGLREGKAQAVPLSSRRQKSSASAPFVFWEVAGRQCRKHLESFSILGFASQSRQEIGLTDGKFVFSSVNIPRWRAEKEHTKQKAARGEPDGFRGTWAKRRCDQRAR